MNLITAIFFQTPGRLRSGWRLLILMIGLIAIINGLNRLLNLAGMPQSIVDDVINPLALMLYGLVDVSAALAVVWIMLLYFENRSLFTIGLPLGYKLTKGFGVGFVLGGLPIGIIVLSVWVFGEVNFNAQMITLEFVLTLTLPALIAILLLAFLEEFILRGYAMQLIAEGAGYWVAITITGIIFGVVHSGNPGANIPGVVNTCINGILLAWLVVRTGSLWIAWGYHVGWNLVSSMVFGLRLSGVMFPGAFIHGELIGPEWITGGEYGFEGSLLAGIIESCILALAVLFANRLPGYPDLRKYFLGKTDPVVQEPDNN
jgi:membrane protease YdiL (CAAX protease family)